MFAVEPHATGGLKAHKALPHPVARTVRPTRINVHSYQYTALLVTAGVMPQDAAVPTGQKPSDGGKAEQSKGGEFLADEQPESRAYVVKKKKEAKV